MNKKNIFIIIGIIAILSVVVYISANNNKSKSAQNKIQSRTEISTKIEQGKQTSTFIASAYSKMAHKNYQEALNDCIKAISINSENKLAYKCSADAKIRMNDFDGAKKDLEHILKIDSNDINAKETLKILNKNR